MKPYLAIVRKVPKARFIEIGFHDPCLGFPMPFIALASEQESAALADYGKCIEIRDEKYKGFCVGLDDSLELYLSPALTGDFPCRNITIPNFPCEEGQIFNIDNHNFVQGPDEKFLVCLTEDDDVTEKVHDFIKEHMKGVEKEARQRMKEALK